MEGYPTSKTYRLIRSIKVPIREHIIFREILEGQIRRPVSRHLARVTGLEFVEATCLHHRYRNVGRRRQSRRNRKARSSASYNLKGRRA